MSANSVMPQISLGNKAIHKRRTTELTLPNRFSSPSYVRRSARAPKKTISPKRGNNPNSYKK
jgi:hypothetical protein